MAERVTERFRLVIRQVSTGAQLPRSGAIAQAGPSPLRQLVVDSSLPVVAALAAIVAVVATVVAWRAGRRARRAADLVAQLLDPPVLEPVACESPGESHVAVTTAVIRAGTEEDLGARSITEPVPADAVPRDDSAPAPVADATSEPLPAIAVPPGQSRDERPTVSTTTNEGHDP